MSTSPFTDKQILRLADMMNPQVPSYDVGPIRTVGSSSSVVDVSSSTNMDGFARNSSGSLDSKIDSATGRYSNILEPHEIPKVSHEKERNTYDVVTVSEVNQTVKKYADKLLHALEGVSSSVSLLESRTRHLEGSIDELKDSVGNNSSSTDGKLRQLESILREVQTGVQVLCDKQDIAEAHLQLTKLLQSSSKEDHYRPPSTESSNAIAPQAPSSQPSYQPAPPPSVVAPPQHQFPAPNATPQQPPPRLPTQLSHFSPPGAHPMQPQPQHQPRPPPQSQHYQLPQYPHQQMPSPHSVDPSSQLSPPEESAPYMPPAPSQTYPPNMQYHGSSQLPFPSGPTFPDGYPYSGGSPSHYSSAMMNPSPFSNSPPSSSGGRRSNSSSSSSNIYSHLPTANVLPQAAPIGPSSSSGNRVPVDDVVDKVVTMGFSREQARAAVRKLMENGQSVDLNVVLDKLMNGR